MSDTLTSFLQTKINNLGLKIPLDKFEELCKVCLQTGPTVDLGSLPYKISPAATEILASESGLFAIIRLVEMLDNPRWSYAFGKVASRHPNVTADRLITCLRTGASEKVNQSVAVFCRLMKDSYGPLYSSALIGALTSAESWDIGGLVLSLSTLDTKDRDVLPHLELYKQKLDLAKNDNAGEAKKQFAILDKVVGDTIRRIKGRENWWKFWKS